MSATKRISIDRVTPGMFVVEMDLPWYRTPFLFHKRLIKDADTIELMRQSGIRTVVIDVSKGKDVVGVPDEKPANPADSPAPSLPASETDESLSPESMRGSGPMSPAQRLYAEAQEAVARIFADLEQGIPPPPAETKAIVSKVLTQVIDDRSSVLTHLAAQQIKQFDRSLAAHSLDVCVLALVVGVESGLDEPALARLGAGALLHDAGYVQLPRNLVRRRDDCSEQERVLLQQHPKLGVALLSRQGNVEDDVLRIVGEHHERGDGSGYPAGSTREAISQLAKIAGLVDLYDGMVSRRGGRAAMLPHDAVRQLFLTGENGQFEKSLVEMVIRSIGVYPVGSLVQLNTGEQAVVVGVNPSQRLKPLVKITGGPQGESYADPITLDLAAQTQPRNARSIRRVLDPAQERVNVAMYLDDTSPRAV